MDELGLLCFEEFEDIWHDVKIISRESTAMQRVLGYKHTFLIHKKGNFQSYIVYYIHYIPVFISILYTYHR